MGTGSSVGSKGWCTFDIYHNYSVRENGTANVIATPNGQTVERCLLHVRERERGGFVMVHVRT